MNEHSPAMQWQPVPHTQEGGGAAREPSTPPSGERRGNSRIWLVLAYVALVHTIDTCANLGVQRPFDWRLFRWVIGEGGILSAPTEHGVRLYALPGFDLFKFVAWLVLPLVFSLPRIDKAYFGWRRLRRIDAMLLLGFAVLGVLAVLTIVAVPGLRGYYPSLSGAAALDKWRYAWHTLIYILSWLTGWEFLHRYVLLTRLSQRWPRFGWLLAPLIEGIYHLVKHPLEMAGMIVLSLALTFWTLKRKNIAPAFWVHACIEIELLIFMLLV